MMEKTVGKADSFFQYIKSALCLDKLHVSREKLIGFGILFVLGLLSGYAIRRFGTIFLIIILVITGIILLQQFDIINISFNTEKISNFMGINQAVVSNNLSMYASWAWQNIFMILSFAIGFFIGIRLG